MAKEQLAQLDEILHDVACVGCEDKVAGMIAEVLGVTATEAQRAAVAGMLMGIEHINILDKDVLREVLANVRKDILEILGLADEVPAA